METVSDTFFGAVAKPILSIFRKRCLTPFLRSITGPFYGMGNAFQLSHAEILEQTSLRIKWPIKCADAPLLVAGVNPFDQFIIAELVGIALAVIDVSAIDLAAPQ